ncbi:MAG TPA: hypothetical protein VGZ22_05980, partial [Isosphaeraceae bacterium]|nr:hypothetical protein [Isosphaeraceae bacterium]
LLAPAGCGEKELPPEVTPRSMKFNEVPAAILKTARQRRPDVKFVEAWTNISQDGKIHSYEIRGRLANGKIGELRISPAGEVLESE